MHAQIAAQTSELRIHTMSHHTPAALGEITFSCNLAANRETEEREQFERKLIINGIAGSIDDNTVHI